MTIKFEDLHAYGFLIGIAIQNEMRRRWNDTIFMSERGYGKHYYENEIDMLADFLLQYYKQEKWNLAV